MSKKVKLVKMNTIAGETLVTEVLYTDPDPKILILKNPCQIMVTRDPTNPQRVNINLRPWEPFTEETEFKIHSDKTLFIVDPLQDLENQYNAAFGAGIVVAPAGTVPTKPNLQVVK